MKQVFYDAFKADLGKSAFFGELTEVAPTIAAVEHDLAELKGWSKETSINSELVLAPATSYVRFEPLGVVAIYGSWNFALGTSLKPLISAISAGNCAIVRPSEVSPASSKAVKQFVDTYLDNTAFACIEGGIDVGVKINNLKLDLICYTGSTQVGKIIATTAAKNLVPCILELGGKCPFVVDVSANPVTAAGVLAQSKL